MRRKMILGLLVVGATAVAPLSAATTLVNTRCRRCEIMESRYPLSSNVMLRLMISGRE